MRINIPKPCHENWDNMTPNQQGRFCGSCQKTVVDFTNFSTEDIQNYFIQNYGKKVCGNFKKQQLDTINIQISSSLFNQIPANRKFALALLIVFGTTLFSCTDNNGNNVNIEQIEVIDSSKNKDYLAEKVLEEEISANIAVNDIEKKVNSKSKTVISTNNKAKGSTPRPNLNCLTGSIRGITSAHFGDEEIYRKDKTVIDYDSSEILGQVEIYPEFIGGEESLYTFLKENLTTPKELAQQDIKGKIVIRFFVEIDGSITDVELLKGLGNAWDQEAIRVVKSMPKWNPGNIKDKPTRLGMILPILIGK